jgi:hypothetical protein
MENTKGDSVKYYCLYKSRVRLLQLVSDGSALVRLTFVDDEDIASVTEHAEQSEVYPFQQTVEQLDQYFQGVRGEALKTASSGAALGASLSPTHYTAPCPTKPYVAMASFCHQSSRAERRWVQPPDAENGGGVGGSRCAIAVIRPDKPLAPAG